MTENNLLIFDFFKRFSSFESALKISKRASLHPSATIIWDSVKYSLEQKNFSLSNEERELEIIKNPPKKLKYKMNEGVLYWDLNEMDRRDSDLAIDVLVNVRNNLYHGSKMFGDSSEGERNSTLVSDALIILDRIVKSLGIEEEYNDIISYWN